VYATGQLFWPDGANNHFQVVFALDRSGPGPALFEPETVSWHGAPDSFGSLGAVTPSGQPVAKRAVPNMAWPPGVSGVFNDIAADGTLFVPGLDRNLNFVQPTMDDMTVGAYDPKTSEWTNIKVRTRDGALTIAPIATPGTLDGEALADHCRMYR
jgi:hypothetical protein